MAPSTVEIQGVFKSFGWRKSKVKVLRGLNLNVPTGTIYGLLGPSGCGKTTLLKCLVGRFRVDKGYIRVFGNAPGTGESKIPGPGVGYMPQELALYDELNIAESLTYIGRVFRMTQRDIKFRIAFLLDLLQLPHKNKLVGNLSGGQKRRVSFAMALVHEPPLLILDEPTVGVDPILRESIWNHLLDMCSTSQVTVIITTHYIEEARQASKIGLMRSGRLLAEDTPNNLLRFHKLPTLEEVYLKLCRLDDALEMHPNDENEKTLHTKRDNANSEFHSDKWSRLEAECCDNVHWRMPSLTRTSANIRNNLNRIKSMKGLVIFLLTIPSISIYIFCSVIGGEPQNLSIAVVNEDTQYGINYLNSIDTQNIHQVQVANLKDGITLCSNGDAAAVLEIWKNFTSSLQDRFNMSGKSVPKEIVEAGTIHIWFDNVVPQIVYSLTKILFNAMEKFVVEHLESNYYRPGMANSLIQVDEPIYGTRVTSFTDFLAPGSLILIIFLLASGMTSLFLVKDRLNGNLDRAYVLGNSSFEIMFGYISTIMAVIAVQILITILVVIGGYQLPSKGSVILVCLLMFLQGFCGTAYGWLISSFADSEGAAMMLVMGSLFPFLFLTGNLWPLAATSKFIKFLGYMLPPTYAIDSLRWITLRGRGLTWTPVWLGFVSTSLWTITILILSIIVMRLRQ